MNLDRAANDALSQRIMFVRLTALRLGGSSSREES